MKKLSLMLLGCIAILSAYGQDESKNIQWQTSAKWIANNEYDVIMKATIDKGYHIYSQFMEEGGAHPTTFDFSENPHIDLVGKTKEDCAHRREYKEPLFNNLTQIELGEEVVFTQRIKAKEPKAVKVVAAYLLCSTSCTLLDKEFLITLPSPTSGNSPLVSEIPKSVPVFEKPLKHPVKWSYKYENLAPKGEYNLVFTAEIDKDWTIKPNEGLGVSPQFILAKKTNVQVLGKIIETKYQEQNILKTEFRQRIQLKNNTEPVKGYIEYQACTNNKNCLDTETLHFVFDFQTGKVEAEAVPPPIASIATPPTSIPTANGSDYPSRFPINKEMSGFSCVDKEKNQNLETQSWWLIFLAGFSGGLLALLTPCVFPMILPVVNYFIKRSKTRTEGIHNALVYGLSIITIYTTLGLSVTAIWGPAALNFAATHWLPNLLFFSIFVAFALSFFGLFEITLPSSWTNAADKKADTGGYLGIFFMAFTLALASFSCTGPLVGALLVATLTDGAKLFNIIPFKPLMGMLGFSTALALPFALFAIFPAWLQSLPRSGKWMDSVKIVLGLVELAIALKFLSSIDIVYQLGILRWEPFLVIWMLLFSAIALFLLGILRFGKSAPDRISPSRWALSTLFFSFVAYMGYGLFTYTPLSILGGLAPPANYNFFNPQECPNGLNCFLDFEDALAAAKIERKPVLIDFTGYGCFNCRKVESTVWRDKPIAQTLSKDYVIAALHTDDKKTLKDKLQYFSTKLNKKVKTVGDKWMDLQAVHFQMTAQPYYVIIDPIELKLLNAPVGNTEDKQLYLKFLECGLENYRKTQQVGMK